MKKVFILFFICFFTMLTGVGHTDTVHYTGVNPGIVVNINAPTIPYSGGVYAGMYNFDILTGSFTGSYKGYCVDPSFEQPWFDAIIIPVTDDSRYEAAAYLLEHYYGDTTTNATLAAQVQMAVWELVWDFGTPYDLTTGNFMTTTGYSSQVNSLITEAVNALGTFSPSGFYVAAGPYPDYYGHSPQDFLFQMVPEPSIIFLLGIGLLGIGVAGRKFVLKTKKI